MQAVTIKRLGMIAGGVLFLVSAGDVGDYLVRALEKFSAHRAYAAAPQSQIFTRFRDLAFAAGADLTRRPTYTSDYVETRTRQFCALLRGNNVVSLTRELAFPPVVHRAEISKGRDLLEGLILRAAAQVQCPDQQARYLRVRGPSATR